MTLRVVFTPRAEQQLDTLYTYIATAAGEQRAESFAGRIVAHCQGFGDLPQRGTRRDDIAPGLRIVGFRRRVTIAFLVEPEVVVIVGIFYGGQDHESVLRAEAEGEGGEFPGV
ncbi:type II toxin-antitoxin system RelE/ParE family toxin [Zavarzinia aquatilis]|uniref:Plasmid stabilization protein n=1 Tax=Zavarzinia aquatilis TaxID=2211142 RepID=A0A317E4D4_9PROT|nr:type II toxin-antitoxin system RelE/ParE family toxin [Zavarzinia aquatilis]PWR21501.1 plasmid stabilization protein [Zavarzinia aquatilis]